MLRTWEPAVLGEVEAVIAVDEYERYALRCLTVHRDDVPAPTVGDILSPSSVWIDGDPTDDLLPGTSGIQVARDAGVLADARRLSNYWGRYVVLMAGNRASHGEDWGEVVIEDAVVLAVYDRGRACLDSDVWGDRGW